MRGKRHRRCPAGGKKKVRYKCKYSKKLVIQMGDKDIDEK